jgi:hypothetical protein
MAIIVTCLQANSPHVHICQSRTIHPIGLSEMILLILGRWLAKRVYGVAAMRQSGKSFEFTEARNVVLMASRYSTGSMYRCSGRVVFFACARGTLYFIADYMTIPSVYYRSVVESL